jgi:guanylate kinase
MPKNITAPIKKGVIFLIVAPSGAGKSSLVAALLKQNSTIDLSISYTTRTIRQGETNGKEYHFVDVETFERMKAHNEFIEWAQVHGNYYGTSRLWLEQELAQHKNILLEIDWQGANQIKNLFQQCSHVVYIFILPPSLQTLEARLKNRAQDSQEIIMQRIQGAKIEIPHAIDADYIVINDTFETAVQELYAITQNVLLYSHVQYQKHTLLMQHFGI